MSTTIRRLTPQDLDEESWAPFGWFPVRDTDPRDGEHRLRYDWSDVHVNLIAHTRDEVPNTSSGLICQQLYRHLTHTQVLMVLNCEAVVVVAPPGARLETEADLDALRVFRLRPQDAFVLFPGTWHWGPYPAHEAEVSLFNVQGLRYAEDNEMADLAARGLALEIAP